MHNPKHVISILLRERGIYDKVLSIDSKGTAQYPRYEVDFEINAPRAYTTQDIISFATTAKVIAAKHGFDLKSGYDTEEPDKPYGEYPIAYCEIHHPDETTASYSRYWLEASAIIDAFEHVVYILEKERGIKL